MSSFDASLPPTAAAISAALSPLLSAACDVDADTIEYLAAMLAEADAADVEETMAPFLEGADVPEEGIGECVAAVAALFAPAGAAGTSGASSSSSSSSKTTQRLGSSVLMSEDTRSSAADDEEKAFLWGTDTYAARFNAQKDQQVAESAKDRRKAKQALEQERKV